MNISQLLEEIRTDAQRWATTQTIPDDIHQMLVDAQVFKVFVPEQFGGHPLGLCDAARLYADLARADGSIAWLVQIGAGGGFFVPSFAPDIAEEVYSHPSAVIAGSGRPSGTARRVHGGYRVSGVWKYASGAQYATTFTANAVVADDSSVRAFAFRRSDVELTADWFSFGMRATSSWTFHVRDVFVPEKHSFVVGTRVWEPPLTVYHTPFLLFALISTGAVACGLVQEMFEEALLYRGGNDLSALDSLRKRAHELIEEFDRLSQDSQSSAPSNSHDHKCEQLQQILSQLRHVSYAALPSLGMSMVNEQTRLSRIVRDMLVTWQHELLRSRVEVPGVEPGSEAPNA